MAETTALPERTHVYQNYALDSLRWNFVALRDDDIVIATSYKGGDYVDAGLVGNLIFSGKKMPAPLGQLSPWVDLRIAPLELMLTGLKNQTHRRFLSALFNPAGASSSVPNSNPDDRQIGQRGQWF